MGIRKSYVKSIGNYYCPGCCKRYDFAPPFLRSFYWEVTNKMSEENFRLLVNEGMEMNAILEELSTLLTLEGRIDLWKSEVSKTVQVTLNEEVKGELSGAEA